MMASNRSAFRLLFSFPMFAVSKFQLMSIRDEIKYWAVFSLGQKYVSTKFRETALCEPRDQSKFYFHRQFPLPFFACLSRRPYFPVKYYEKTDGGVSLLSTLGRLNSTPLAFDDTSMPPSQDLLLKTPWETFLSKCKLNWNLQRQKKFKVSSPIAAPFASYIKHYNILIKTSKQWFGFDCLAKSTACHGVNGSSHDKPKSPFHEGMLTEGKNFQTFELR